MAEPTLQLERPREGLLHRHLLVERESDQERVGIARDQPVRLRVGSEVELGGCAHGGHGRSVNAPRGFSGIRRWPSPTRARRRSSAQPSRAGRRPSGGPSAGDRRELGVGEGGLHEDDVHALVAELAVGGSREQVDGGLGRRIRPAARVGELPDDRRDVHDPTRALLHHPLAGRADAVDHAHDVHAHHRRRHGRVGLVQTPERSPCRRCSPSRRSARPTRRSWRRASAPRPSRRRRRERPARRSRPRAPRAGRPAGPRRRRVLPARAAPAPSPLRCPPSRRSRRRRRRPGRPVRRAHRGCQSPPCGPPCRRFAASVFVAMTTAAVAGMAQNTP